MYSYTPSGLLLRTTQSWWRIIIQAYHIILILIIIIIINSGRRTSFIQTIAADDTRRSTRHNLFHSTTYSTTHTQTGTLSYTHTDTHTLGLAPVLYFTRFPIFWCPYPTSWLQSTGVLGYKMSGIFTSAVCPLLQWFTLKFIPTICQTRHWSYDIIRHIKPYHSQHVRSAWR